MRRIPMRRSFFFRSVHCLSNVPTNPSNLTIVLRSFPLYSDEIEQAYQNSGGISGDSDSSDSDSDSSEDDPPPPTAGLISKSISKSVRFKEDPVDQQVDVPVRPRWKRCLSNFHFPFKYINTRGISYRII